jgi:effector-binding domain-containing protein
MAYICETYHQTATPVLSMRVHVPVHALPDFLSKAFSSIFQYLAELGEIPAGVPFVAYYNMDMQDLDVEAGYPVARPLAGRDEIQPGSLPEGPVAETIYTGPYVEMGSAYEELTSWVTANRHVASGVVYEFYLNDPAQVLPEQLQTRIVFLLKA